LSSVDVVVPSYNYGRYLRACAQSVLSQTGVDVRVLVIDDASPDETSRIGAELAAADPRLEFRRHAVNKGHIATYNEGVIGWSTAPYVVLLSSDDMLAPGALERATRIMEADPTVGMVYGRAYRFEDEAQLGGFDAVQRGVNRWTGREWLEGRCRAGHNVISSPEVVVRGTVQRAVGGYSSRLPHVADFEMWLRIAAISNVAYVRGVPQAFYRQHQTNMTRQRTALVDLRERRAAFEMFFERRRDLGTDGTRLHDLARRALAQEALWLACRAYDRDQVRQTAADDLVDFALLTYARARSLPEYAALRRRQRLGAAVCKRTQVFAAPALVRRWRKWRWWRRWEQEGI